MSTTEDKVLGQDEKVTDFSKPTKLSKADQVFPARAEDYMPTREFCEAELEKLPAEERQKWVRFQQKWFFNGLPETTEVELKHDGIDGATAFAHLGSIQGSFQPKHEHKEVAVAYLASLWFADVRYE